MLRRMVAEGARISWEYPHAQERARERCIPKFLAERVLRTGEVRAVRSPGTSRERWRVVGRPDNERELIVVIALGRDGVLRVVTVFDK